jgi:hypothetical protein
LIKELEGIDCSQLLHQSAADVSHIIGVRPPNGKTIEQLGCEDLRKYISCHGGKVSMNKLALIKTCQQCRFIKQEVAKTYIDRNTNKNSSFYAKIDTSCTRDVGTILFDLKSSFARTDADGSPTRSLVEEAQHLFSNGFFDASFNNISRVAPELPESLIYCTYGHSGQSTSEKNMMLSVVVGINQKRLTMQLHLCQIKILPF